MYLSICYVLILLLSGISLSGPYGLTPSWTDDVTGITMDATLVDIDGDLDLDIVAADYSYPDGGNLYLYLNESGVLTRVWTSGLPAGYECVTTGDMNNDGYLDIVAGTVNLLPNDGHNMIYYGIPPIRGYFNTQPGWISPDHKDTYDVFLADIDKDGYLEIITANKSARLLVYNNNAGTISSPIDFLEVCNNSSVAISIFANGTRSVTENEASA